MTGSQQQAKYLVDKFYPLSTSYSLGRNNQLENAKQNAINAVNEILKFLSIQVGFYDENGILFWKEVKQEIKNYESKKTKML